MGVSKQARKCGDVQNVVPLPSALSRADTMSKISLERGRAGQPRSSVGVEGEYSLILVGPRESAAAGRKRISSPAPSESMREGGDERGCDEGEAGSTCENGRDAHSLCKSLAVP
jgi:hypothetical protein